MENIEMGENVKDSEAQNNIEASDDTTKGSETNDKSVEDTLYGDSTKDESGQEGTDTDDGDGDNASDDGAPDKKTEKSDKDSDSGSDDTDPGELVVKLSDDSLLDPSYADKISQIAKEKGLSQEQVDLLAGTADQAVKDYVESVQSNHIKTIEKDWPEAVKKDEELGGKNFQESVEVSKRALEALGTPELKELLNESGYGNHPEVVRFFSRLGRKMQDDKLVISNAQNAEPAEDPPVEELFYGKSGSS
jgi:hypothetical protein